MAQFGAQAGSGRLADAQLFSSQDQINQTSASPSWLADEDVDEDEAPYYASASGSPMRRWPMEAARSPSARKPLAEQRRVDIVISSPQRYAKLRGQRYAAGQQAGLGGSQQFWTPTRRQTRALRPPGFESRAAESLSPGRMRYLWPQQHQRPDLITARRQLGGGGGGRYSSRRLDCQHSSPSSAGSHSGWSSNYGAYTANDQLNAANLVPTEQSRAHDGLAAEHLTTAAAAAANRRSGEPAYCNSNASSSNELDSGAALSGPTLKQTKQLSGAQQLAHNPDSRLKRAADSPNSVVVVGDKQPPSMVADNKAATLTEAAPAAKAAELQSPRQQQAVTPTCSSGCPLFGGSK